MKQLLFALFIVLAYSTATGGTERNAGTYTALREMIDDIGHLQDIGKDTWDSLPTFKQQHSSMPVLRCFNKGLRNLNKKCSLIKEKEMCIMRIEKIKNNLKSLPMTQHQEPCENKRFADFLMYLTSFLQKTMKSKM